MKNEEKTTEEKIFHFEKLTPTADADTSVYEKALDFVFENNDVKNIAISGAYGSGKSSMLNSYKKKNSERKFMHLSLAHFQTENGGKPTEENVLEGKILNQLIHQIDASKIPQTNFKVKKKISAKRIIAGVSLTLLFLMSLFYAIFFSGWESFVKTLSASFVLNILQETLSPWARLISGVVVLGLLGLFIYKIIKAQLNKNIFKKLSIQGNEIEIFEDSKESYFDKYLNEVLYLFENVEADVIVFEDMDRFDAHQIFERLREINTLVNLQLEKKNKVLRFFYLLKDDIFISKDRTKFFDFIIPIVPIVDSSNSYDQFIAHLKKTGIFEKFTQKFLKGLSLYIDDMRLLKNICNEFLIYFNRLDKIELSYDKMLAIIAYKNLFPRDFSELQLGRGFVANLFSKKDDFVSEETENIQKEIDLLNSQIEKYKSEVATSIEELDTIFWDKSSSTYRRSNIENYLSGDNLKEYRSRKENLKKRKEISLETLEQKVVELNKRKQELGGLQLFEIITRDNIDTIFATKHVDDAGNENDFKEIRENDYFKLLKFLIRNGYLDESYSDYMTYFYENSLTVVDKNFLRSITDKVSKEYNYELRSPELVFSHLSEFDFDEPEVLNFSLFTYLLATKKEKFLRKIIVQLRDDKKFDFVWEYFEKRIEKENLLKILAKEWPQLLLEVVNTEVWSKEQIKCFSVEILVCLTMEELESCNQNNCLTKLISLDDKYLDIATPNINRIINAFKHLNVKFEKINYQASNKDLFDEVYKNSLYSLNYDNIELMLKVFGNASEEEIKHKNYSVINSMKDGCIKTYVDLNIVDYLNVVLDNSEGQIFDEENVVTSILNNTLIQKTQKENYLSQLKSCIIDLTKIEDFSYWSKVINAENLVFSEKNILEYFIKSKALDDILLNYINKTDKIIDLSSLVEEYEIITNFFNTCLINNGLKNDKYEQIIRSIGIKVKSFNVADLSNEKVLILIKEKTILMNEENLVFVRENYATVLLEFIEVNINDYLSIMDENLLEHKEVLEILDWDIDEKIKLQLLSFDDTSISILNKNYPIGIQSHILKNNYDERDEAFLYDKYSNLDETIRDIVFGIVLRDVDNIIEEKKPLDYKLLHELLTKDNILLETKVEILVSQFNYIGEDLIKELLLLLGLSKFLDIFNSYKKPRFEINPQNELLLIAFKGKGWIFEYYQDDKRPDTYLIRRRPPIKNLPTELL